MNCKIIIVLFVLSALTATWCQMLGPGLWVVRNVEMCPNNDEYESPVEITRKKLNRTHDGFTVRYRSPNDITTETALDITVFKQVDGGWKTFHVIQSDNFCDFCKNNTKENFVKVLRAAGQPEDCPIAKGDYEIKDYIIDYESLPNQCIYGMFKVEAYLVEKGRRVTCVFLFVECLEKVPTAYGKG